MSAIELSWTAKNAYFIPIWTIRLQKFSVIFHKWGGGRKFRKGSEMMELMESMQLMNL